MANFFGLVKFFEYLTKNDIFMLFSDMKLAVLFAYITKFKRYSVALTLAN